MKKEKKIDKERNQVEETSWSVRQEITVSFQYCTLSTQALQLPLKMLLMIQFLSSLVGVFLWNLKQASDIS